MTVNQIVSLGERNERLLISMLLAAIALWGFTGWEYPETEVILPPSGNIANFSVAGEGLGEQLFQANGCYACHSLDGERIVGPSLLGIFGSNVELEGGRSVLIDDAYLIESILQPDAKRVAGYGDAAMPSYEGIVSTEDAEALADYIKGLR